MPWWALAMLMLGANFALWGSVGLIRLAESVLTRGGGPPDPPDRRSAAPRIPPIAAPRGGLTPAGR